MAFKGRHGEVARSVRIENREMISWQDLCIGEYTLSRFTPDDVVGTSRVNIYGNRAIPVVGRFGVYDLAQHYAAGFADLTLQDVKLTCLRVMIEAHDGADGSQVL
jgi:hypothetical protein